MMGIQLLFIMTACIANLRLSSAQPLNQITNQARAVKVNEDSEIRGNFQNLFDSIANNASKKRETYRTMLEEEVAKERQAFDVMNEELRIAQNRNALKKVNFYKNNDVDENAVVLKRETKKENTDTSSTVANIRRRTYTFTWEGPTEPISTEDEDGMTLVVPELLCQYALNLTSEVLDLERIYIVRLAEEFEKIKEKNKMKWAYKFENILSNCELVVDTDQDEIRERLVGAYGAPNITHNPFRPASISNLVHNFNHMRILLEGEEDEQLKGVDEEIKKIHHITDEAEADLHRFNFRVRKIMNRITRRLSSKAVETTPSLATTI